MKKDMDMDDPNQNQIDDVEQEQTSDPIEESLEVYPLRKPSEDPGWAVKTAWIWTFIACGLLLFLTTLTVLGLWYD